MQLYYEGVIIAISTFLIIGIFHPVVVKVEYYFGTKPWWIFLFAGILSICGAFCIKEILYSAILGVLGASIMVYRGNILTEKKGGKRMVSHESQKERPIQSKR